MIALAAIVLAALPLGDVNDERGVELEEMDVRTVGPGGGGYLYSMGMSALTNRLYVGCDVGGFYRSDDLGRNYKILNTGLPNMMMLSIAEHPLDPDTILIGNTGGACISKDGGYHWKNLRSVAKGVCPMNLYDKTWPIQAVAWSQANPKRAWMGTGRWNHKWRQTKDEAQVWRTDDGCESLEMILPKDSPLLKEKQIFALSPHPTNADEILCTTPGGIYLSTDGGVNWTKQTKGLPTDSRVWARWVNHSRSNPLVVYASFVQFEGKFDPKHPHESGVWKSTDGGRSWTKCGMPKVNPLARSVISSFWNEACVFVDPRDENVVWASGLCFFEDSIWKSTDGGKTWQKSFTGAPQGWLDFWGRGVPKGMAMCPANPDIVGYGNSGSVYLTEDGGKTWHQRYTGSLDKKNCSGRGLEVTCMSGLVPDCTIKDRWYLPYMDLGLMITDNRGETLHRSTTGIPSALRGTCFSLVPSPDDPKLLWSTWGRWGDYGKLKAGGVFAVSRDAGENWSVQTNGGWTFAKWPRLAHLKGKQGNDILFAVSKWQFLQESRDGGAHWTTNAFPYPKHLLSVATHAGNVYVGTRLDETRGNFRNGAIWKSADEGRTWENLTAGVTNRIAGIETMVFPNDDTIVIVASHPHSARNAGVYVSRDRGKTWKRTLAVVQAGCAVMQGKRIVVGCDRREFCDPFFSCGGVYVSDDCGDTWKRLIAPGFDRPGVGYLAVHPSRPDELWVGTHGNSIFVLSPKKAK